eukprot:CAMPEP_0183598890 /NCGR_PEP_ID=MMETSP0371-20130417/179156_1 /TAXON_ID=268820 /ORGANISM="Peridinium aciculiferum, Strain PAER-2" /LENGTH=338 /DNA_ID=CAMNT_0025810951 /DNA_START=387 /DNA_END=1399 /DNA_ORIENTATION=-
MASHRSPELASTQHHSPHPFGSKFGELTFSAAQPVLHVFDKADRRVVGGAPREGGLATHSCPHLLDLILCNQGDHRMRRDAHVVGREAGPQTRDAADLDLLHGAIDRALEWHLTGHRIGLRLLDLRLDIIEREREEGGEETGDGVERTEIAQKGKSAPDLLPGTFNRTANRPRQKTHPSLQLAALAAHTKRGHSLDAHGGPHLLHLVLGHQGDHRMRSDAHIVGREAGPQASDATDLDLLHCAIDGALEGHLTGHRVGLRLLDLRLDIIEREREEGGEEAGDGGRAEGLSGSRDADRLELVLRQAVEAQHAEVQGHRTGRGRNGTLEEATDPVGLDDA